VPEGATDAPLELRRIGAFGEELGLVVELKQQPIAAGIGVQHVATTVAQVREHAQLHAFAMEAELHRFSSIVGDRHGAHGDRTQGEAVLATEATVLRPRGKIHAPPGAPGGVYGHPGTPGKHTDAAGVIACSWVTSTAVRSSGVRPAGTRRALSCLKLKPQSMRMH
jgi:hypothetical protein